jgi:sugar/nucleoside kinase (ribokinase family)
LAEVEAWCACFDALQGNEQELSMLAPDPMTLAATAFSRRAGLQTLFVTLGPRGVVYFEDAGPGRPLRTALVPASPARVAAGGDPTGCGDVWGATYFSRRVAGDTLSVAMRAACDAAARNVEHRGATGLAHHLRGELHPL